MTDNPEALKLMKIAKEAISREAESKEGFNEIIAELAKKASLNTEEVNRVVEWTNTIKMLNMYKSGSDKTEEFDVADPKKVNGLIYKEAEAVLDDADFIVSKSQFVKMASSNEKVTPKPKEFYNHERSSIIKKAYAKLKDVSNKVEESKILSIQERDRFLNKMAELSDKLNKHYSETFAEFEINARSKLGEACLPYLDVLEKMASNNNVRALNFKPKNVTKNTENFSLLKEAMVASKAHHFYKNTANGYSSIHNELKSKIEGKLK